MALCIAGSARSFSTKLVLTHMRHNLITAMAVNDRSRLFLHLKLNDSEKISGGAGQKFRSHRESSLDGLLATLQLPWMATRIGEATIVNGSGTYTGIGCTKISEACVVQPRQDTWKRYRSLACTDAERAQRQVANDTRKARCCPPYSSYHFQGNNEERLLLAQLGIAWCGNAIPRYERINNERFQSVLFARPDLFWERPTIPWCEWPIGQLGIGCDYPACDMAWVVPRSHFARMSALHEMHRDCPAHSSGKHTCCSTSEHLLIFARSHLNATHFLSRTNQLHLSAEASARFYKGPSILRSIKGICEMALHPVLTHIPGKPPSKAPGTFVFKHQQQSGVLVKTTLRLRNLFTPRNESAMDAGEFARSMLACRRAMSTYQLTPSGPSLQISNDSKVMAWAEWAEQYLRKFKSGR